MAEKAETLLMSHQAPARRELYPSFRRRIAVSFVLLFVAFVVLLRPSGRDAWPLPTSEPGGLETYSVKCPQVDPLVPSNGTKKLGDMDQFLKTNEFREQSVTRLSGAVKIPSMSFDDMGAIGEDKRWDIFYEFADYLKATYPKVHDTLSLDVVNTHGLVYTWTGSNKGLKPTLLMAHQDVVPVPESTVSQWTHPPFEGVYDGKYVWGRGSSDCKNQLTAILEAVELLIEAEFQPTRTLVLSFGFDEEISGGEGAGHLAPFLLERYGKDGIAVIVDEGAGIQSAWGSVFAMPGVGEKGYIDVDVIIRVPGGHSSVPPDHNGIGVMSELITHIEASKYEPHLDKQNPYLGLLWCGSEHSSNFPKSLKKLLPFHSQQQCSAKKDRLAIEAAKAGPAIRYLMQTSIAVDVINGGVKVNALPERTVATVNHRVNVGEHTSNVKDKLTHIAKGIADKYNLSLHAFDDAEETPSSITLRATRNVLEPAPVTPTSIDPASAYSVLSGTTRALYGEELLMAPGIMTGNTDTKYYWDLTQHIFRYAPGWDPEEEGFGSIHTVNERVSVKAHVATVQWFSLFVRNMDQAALA